MATKGAEWAARNWYNLRKKVGATLLLEEEEDSTITTGGDVDDPENVLTKVSIKIILIKILREKEK